MRVNQIIKTNTQSKAGCNTVLLNNEKGVSHNPNSRDEKNIVFSTIPITQGADFRVGQAAFNAFGAAFSTTCPLFGNPGNK